MMRAFAVLAKFKGLRQFAGGVFDIFGRTAERKMERQLIVDYVAMIDEVLSAVSANNYDTAVDLASVPEHIRGYGHVKDAHFKEAKKLEAELLAKFRNPVAGMKEIRIKVAA